MTYANKAVEVAAVFKAYQEVEMLLYACWMLSAILQMGQDINTGACSITSSFYTLCIYCTDRMSIFLQGSRYWSHQPKILWRKTKTRPVAWCHWFMEANVLQVSACKPVTLSLTQLGDGPLWEKHVKMNLSCNKNLSWVETSQLNSAF